MPLKARLLELVLAALAASLLSRFPPVRAAGAEFNLDSPVDVLLGKNQKSAFAEGLSKKELDGKTHAWEQYVAWGRSLAIEGRVKDPPIGPAPSVPLAETYRCVHCHNLAREDLQLTAQDPERREKIIRSMHGPEPEKREGSILGLTAGTTLWGAVNRERFYNGHYERYHFLKTGDGRKMDPHRLADAVEVCCSYCSAGRFPDTWELDSLIAFLWSLELRLKDLDLAEKEARDLLHELQCDDEETVAQARKTLRSQFITRSGADAGEEPQRIDDAVDSYADGTRYVGLAGRGSMLYRSACAGCHGEVHPKAGAELVAGDKLFHRYVWKGTERDGLYMPLFTQQRLSRQQAADIRAYLRSLPKP